MLHACRTRSYVAHSTRPVRLGSLRVADAIVDACDDRCIKGVPFFGENTF